MRSLLSFIFLMILLAGCQRDVRVNYQIGGYDDMVFSECVSPSKLEDLVPYNVIIDAFDVDVSSMRTSQGALDVNRSKGFILWDIEGDFENRGIFFSLSRNINPDRGDDYVSQMVSGLKTTGERDNEGNVEKYSEWVELGDDSAYSEISHTYVWQLKNCIVFKMVFNLPFESTVIHAAAAPIAKELSIAYIKDVIAQ